MTIDRVKFDGSGGSPLRISVDAVDVNGAEFNTLIFDANQSPLRLWATGYVTISGITDADFILGKNVVVLNTGSFPTPVGTTPIFITAWRRTDDPNGFVTTPTFRSRVGGGGGVCSGQFVGANFHAQASGVGGPGPSIFCNYCIFKDYN